MLHSINFETLLNEIENKRFSTLLEINEYLQKLFNKTEIELYFSEDRENEVDFGIDGSFRDENSDRDFTIYYAKSQNGSMYITETNFWN